MLRIASSLTASKLIPIGNSSIKGVDGSNIIDEDEWVDEASLVGKAIIRSSKSGTG